jgi:hypothetical protein
MFAEMEKSVKNEISHRKKALALLLAHLIAEKEGIQTLNACTLVMLATGAY